MAITPTELRKDLYRILDKVLETGEPVEIKRGDKTVKIVPSNVDEKKVDYPSRMKNLRYRPDVVVGDIDTLVHLDWSKEWRP